MSSLSPGRVQHWQEKIAAIPLESISSNFNTYLRTADYTRTLNQGETNLNTMWKL